MLPFMSTRDRNVPRRPSITPLYLKVQKSKIKVKDAKIAKIGPGNMTVVRLLGPETLNDLGPNTRDVEP